MLPVLLKPKVDYNLSTFVTEIPGALNLTEINRLIDYANSDGSGFHRRGSKDNNVDASFSTCQVHPFSDELYSLLDPLWEPYKSAITFIEPYEIKSYVEGDKFDYHMDVYYNLFKKVDRKLNLIIQLADSGNYEGGDLFVGNYRCTRQQGSAIFFPACLTHCVKPIISGTRYSLIGHGWGEYII